MIKTVQFEGHSLEIDTSGGWFFVYREYFGHDILPDIMPALESALQMAVDVIGRVDTEELDAKAVINALGEDTLEEMFFKMAGAEITTILQIFWAMAKNRDNSIPQPREFYNQFDCFPWDEVGPLLMKALLDSNISSKNVKSLLENLKKSRNQSISTKSSSQESTEG